MSILNGKSQSNQERDRTVKTREPVLKKKHEKR